MTSVELAQAILRQSPLPDNAEAQIDALYKTATGDEKEQFAWIYEGLSLAQSGAGSSVKIEDE